VRPAGIAASDEEHAAALQRAIDIDEWLQAQGWPAGVYADSGNGGHLLFRLDLPVDDGGLVERCLKALAARFDDEQVRVDTGVFNPARIWKLYGTLAGKGDAEAAKIGRPHRMARILNAPDELLIVTTEQLEALAAQGTQNAEKTTSTTATPSKASGQQFDLAEWISRQKLDVTGPDVWQGSGRRWVFRACPWNPDHTDASAFIVQWPSGKIGAGCHHNSCQGRDWHALRDTVEPGWREQKRSASDKSASDRRSQGSWESDDRPFEPIIVKLADVQPEQVQWLWPGRIALGKLTLIAGEPGLGKSFLTLDIAARVSRGRFWPDDPPGEPPACAGVSDGRPWPPPPAPLGSVVLLSAEDDVADTIRPRLDAAGADVEKIIAIQGMEFHGRDKDKQKERAFSLEYDLPALEKAITSLPDCKLVVIDPVSAYCGRVDSHNNAETRGLLAPLTALAAKHKVAVLIVTHLNKNAGSKALHRFIGSIAFVAAARTAWLVAADKQHPARRLLLPVKNNLTVDRGGLAYGIVEGALAWERGPVSMTADDAIGEDRRQDGHTERDDAADWLRELLADGEVPQKEVKEAAKDNGYAWATVRRAKTKLGIKPKKEGFGKEARWLWRLPDQRCSKDAEDAQPQGVSTFDTFGEGEHLQADEPDESAA
jgi:putative DNA primase/helicase